jgi:glycosyltransferase involved in cell wall biosynthesis
MICTTVISIVVPIYKVEKYLDKCVLSLLRQTYTNLEIFLVDDGSPDNCGKMCDDYAQKDNRIKVIHKKNGGLADARNAAIDVATGEWIVFVDSDDYVEPDYVENLFSLTQKYDCKIAHSGFRYVFEDEEYYFPKIDSQEKECCYDKWNALKILFLQQNIGNEAWGKIYHKSLFETGIRYPYGLIYEDLPTTYRLFLLCDKIAYSSKKTYNYLMRSTSIEGAKFNKRKSESAVIIIQSIQGHFNELHPILPAVKSRLFSLAMHVLLAMPDNYSGCDKDFLIDYVKKNRLAVLLGKMIRPRARFAALLSLGGLSICKTVFAKMKGNITLRRSKNSLGK